MARVSVPISQTLSAELREYVAAVADNVRRSTNTSALLRSPEDEIPALPGLYALYDSGTLVYVGETGCLSKRYADLFQTRNHSFRRKLGAKLFSQEPGYVQGTTTHCFIPQHETQLTTYMEQRIRYAIVPMEFGRKEAEEMLVASCPNLLNSRGRRGEL